MQEINNKRLQEMIASENKHLLRGDGSDPQATGGTIGLIGSEAGQGDPPVGRKIFHAKSDPRGPLREIGIGRATRGRVVDRVMLDEPITVHAPFRRSVVRIAVHNVLYEARRKAQMAKAVALAAQEFADA
jgi:hypothetical protein